MAAKSNVLIFGATGLIGSHITHAILEKKDSFGRIGVFTSSNNLWTKSDEIDALKAQGVEIFAGNLTSADAVNEAYRGFDTVVSCVGRPVIAHQELLIRLADQHPDIKRFFPSEYGTDPEHGPSSASERPLQSKLKIRALLKALKNLEYTCIATGPYADADQGLYLCALPKEHESAGTFDVKRKRAVLLGDGNGKLSMTTMRDVGKLVVSALLRPEHGQNKALRVSSFTTTPREIVAEFEKVTGGEQWRVDYTSLDELRAMEQHAWKANEPMAGVLSLKRIWTGGGAYLEQRDNKLLGMEDAVDSLHDAVKQAVEVQSK